MITSKREVLALELTVTNEEVLGHPTVQAFFRARQDLAESTWYQYRLALRFLFECIYRLYKEPPEEVDFAHFVRYTDGKGKVIRTGPLQPRHVRRLAMRYYEWELEGGYRSRYVRHASCWRGFLGFLYAEGITREDCSRAVMTPREPRRIPRQRTLTSEQVEALLRAAANHPSLGPCYWALLVILVNSGFRPGALTNLCWGDIRDGRLAPLSNKRGREIAPELPGVRQALTHYKDWWREQFGSNPEPDQRVFDNPMVRVRSTRDLNRVLRELASKAKVDIPKVMSGRWFRPTVGTTMYESGIPVPVIQDLLGHRHSSTTTQHYVHAELEAERRLRERVQPLREVLRLLRSPRPGRRSSSPHGDSSGEM